MVVLLEDVKKYLKVEHDIEDTTITGFINTSEELVEGILRYPLTDFEDEVPEAVKLAIIYITSNMYEKREEVNIKEVLDTAKNLLFMQRKESW